MNEKYLVESCLLTHGLRSVTDEEMMQTWQGVNATFAWIDKGKIQTGSVEQFIEFRKRKIKLRVNYKNIDEMLEKNCPGSINCVRNNGSMPEIRNSDSCDMWNWRNRKCSGRKNLHRFCLPWQKFR